jgi:hypothetical protein
MLEYFLGFLLFIVLFFAFCVLAVAFMPSQVIHKIEMIFKGKTR